MAPQFNLLEGRFAIKQDIGPDRWAFASFPTQAGRGWATLLVRPALNARLEIRKVGVFETVYN